MSTVTVEEYLEGFIFSLG